VLKEGCRASDDDDDEVKEAIPDKAFFVRSPSV
jgi:hypothetical protein